jgi:DnaD/phage-associated family protein
MARIRLTPPGERRERGARARLYFRWMPHLGAEAVALYELLRTLPHVVRDSAEPDELAELLRSTPEAVEEALNTLIEFGFATNRDGWLEVSDHPPVARESGSREAETREAATQNVERVEARGARSAARGSEAVAHEAVAHEAVAVGGSGGGVHAGGSRPEVRVVRAAPEGVSPDDYFKYMGSLPAPHILEFLNGYCERDGLHPDAVREALRIASERDARRVGYVRSILERWVERGVKSVEDVERFERDRKLRLVEESGAVKGGALKAGKGVKGDGADRRSAARRREGYEWLFGE